MGLLRKLTDRRQIPEPGGGPVVVSGVAVHPPVSKRQAERLAASGLLVDKRADLLHAWVRIEEMWSATTSRALALPGEALDRRVNDEWSFLETLRHLIFVTDGWIGAIVDGNRSPHHPIGLPPDSVTNVRHIGLITAARPAVDTVLRVRADRLTHVRETITRLTDDDLARRSAKRFGSFTVLGALQNVIFEEWAHHEYAARDLAQLESGP
jgi:hypothetical protein